MKGAKPLLATLAMTAGLLCLAYSVAGHYGRFAAEHWRGQLGTVADDRADLLLRQAAALGEPGIPVLVEALGSDRESVSLEGKRLLDEQIHVWQGLNNAERSARLTALARALASRAGRFGPSAQGDAALLARRILDGPLDTDDDARRQIIAYCDRIIRETGQAEPRTTGPAGQSLKVASAEIQTHDILGADDARPGDSLIGLSRLAGGGLPVGSPAEPAPMPWTTVDRQESPGEEGLAFDPPRHFATPVGARLLNAPNALREANATPSGAPRPSGEANRAVILSLNVLDEPDRDGLAGATSVGPVSASAVAAMDTIRLMELLRSPQALLAEEVRAELTRRGFTEVQIEMARRLFDPDPEVRRQLARTLPAITSVDATPWLLWLSRDADPEVRLVAIGLIATTGDGSLQRQVEQAAREDPDPRIRRQAEQIAQRRGGVIR